MTRQGTEQNKLKLIGLTANLAGIPVIQPATGLAAKPNPTSDIARHGPARAQFAHAGRLRRFRELVAFLVEDELVVMIGRLRQPEQCLQQAMDAGGPEQILTAHDVGDALERIVEYG